MFKMSWSSGFVMQIIHCCMMGTVKTKFKFVCNVKFPEAN